MEEVWKIPDDCSGCDSENRLLDSSVAFSVAKKIENELEYPGQIKVTVIREVRAQDIAK